VTRQSLSPARGCRLHYASGTSSPRRRKGRSDRRPDPLPQYRRPGISASSRAHLIERSSGRCGQLHFTPFGGRPLRSRGCCSRFRGARRADRPDPRSCSRAEPRRDRAGPERAREPRRRSLVPMRPTRLYGRPGEDLGQGGLLRLENPARDWMPESRPKIAAFVTPRTRALVVIAQQPDRLVYPTESGATAGAGRSARIRAPRRRSVYGDLAYDGPVRRWPP